MIVVVKSNGGLEDVTAKFSKLELVATEVRHDNRINVLKFQGINAIAKSMVGIGAGSTVQITFDIEGREWDSGKGIKVFMNLNVVSFRVLNEVGVSNVVPKAVSVVEVADSMSDDLFTRDEDLPF